MRKDSKGSGEPTISRTSVLDDLGFKPEEALEIRVKAEVYGALLQCIQRKTLTQQQLAEALDLHQPDVSNLLSGKLSKFSVGKLLQFAGKLNLEAEVRIHEPRLRRSIGAVARKKQGLGGKTLAA